MARSCICSCGLREHFRQIVPGVSEHVRRLGRRGAPMTWGDDALVVLPATLPLDELVAGLRSPTPP